MVAQLARQLHRAQVIAPLLQPLHDHHLLGFLQRLGQREHVQRGGLAHGAQQFIAFLAAQLLVQLNGLQRRKAGGREGFGGVFHALLRQPARGACGIGRRQRERQAAAQDGRQQLLRLVRHQDEQHARRRFFEIFQQGIRGIGVHRLGGVNDDHAPAALMGGHAGKVGQPAHLVDGNLLAGFLAGCGLRIIAFLAILAQRLRLQQAKVRVRALGKPVARRALSAGKTGFIRLLAQQAPGEIHRQIELADPFASLEQQTMRRAFAQLLQTRPIIFLPRIYIIHIKAIKLFLRVFV